MVNTHIIKIEEVLLMEWLEQVKEALKKKRKILFDKDNELLQELSFLLEKENRKVITLWALDFADEITKLINKKHLDDRRPNEAAFLCREWAEGKIKMPPAKAALLQVHAMSKEMASDEDVALCHAVGQACSVVHTTGHAMGLPIYELTAIVRGYGIEGCRNAVENRVEEYIERLHYWGENSNESKYKWADFIK